jgi:hypothetical protein
MNATAKRRAGKILGAILGVLLLGGFSVSAAGTDRLVVDRFQEFGETNPSGYPQGWTLERNQGKDSRVEIVREGAAGFLRMISKKDAWGLKKAMKVDIRRFSHLSWEWRVWENPKRGDIRSRETDDQAGQIYVLFPRFPGILNTRAVGYIWDPTAPQGHSGTSPCYEKMKYTVLRSGEAGVRRWLAESRNVLEDYRRLFGEDPPEAGGVLLFINSQFTGTAAECHYREIVFSAIPTSRPPEGK